MKIPRSLALLVLLLLTAISHAQDMVTGLPDALFTFTILEHPYEGSDNSLLDYYRIEWLPDSLSFRFPYATSSRNSTDYYPRSFQYFVETRELRSEQTGDCRGPLTNDEVLALNMNGCLGAISPDGRYIIFATHKENCGETCSPVLALADLKTNTSVILDSPIYTYYVVHWSKNIQAFLIFAGAVYGGGGGIYHARIPEALEDIPQLDLTLLDRFEPEYPEFVDISPDGWQVLLRGDGETPLGLTLWDARWPSTHQQFAAYADGRVLIKGEIMSGAKFLTDRTDQILVVLEHGIVRYNLTTGEEVLINPYITAGELRWVYFSPDDQYALVFDDGWHTGRSDDEKHTHLSLFHVNPDEEGP